MVRPLTRSSSAMPSPSYLPNQPPRNTARQNAPGAIQGALLYLRPMLSQSAVSSDRCTRFYCATASLAAPTGEARTKVLITLSGVEAFLLCLLLIVAVALHTKEAPMSRYRQLIVTLGVVALLLLTFGAAAAKPNDTPKPPHGAGHLPAS